MTSNWLSGIADHLWQSSLFATFALTLVTSLKKQSARVRHRIWMVASLKFLIPMSLLIWCGNQIAYPKASAVPPLHFSEAAIGFSKPFTQARASSSATTPTLLSISKIESFLVTVWACGFLGLTCSWFIRWKQIQRAVRSGSLVKLEIPIDAVVSPVMSEPGVFGILRPVLVLPQGVLNCLSPAQLKAVVAHELCHVRHRDNLVAAIHMLVESAFWFHPLVWWIGKQMITERERACDEEVLLLGADPKIYAAGLLRICTMYAKSQIACVSGVTGSNLKKRIQTIVAMPVAVPLSFAAKAGLAAIGTACIGLPVLIGISSAPTVYGQDRSVLRSDVKFRSASIRPCTDYSERSGISHPSSGRLVLHCQTVMSLIGIAYSDLPAVSNGPGWSMSAAYRYSIDARADDGTSLELMKGPLLQALLESRFRLKIRRETREASIYFLTAGSAPKLHVSSTNSCTGAWPSNAPVPPEERGNCVTFVGRGHGLAGEGDYFTLEGQAIRLEDLCNLLAIPLGQPVVDKTAIPGTFDFHLTFSGNSTPAALNALYPRLSHVVEEQLGLKLKQTTAPRNFLVIDQVEKPFFG